MFNWNTHYSTQPQNQPDYYNFATMNQFYNEAHQQAYQAMLNSIPYGQPPFYCQAPPPTPYQPSQVNDGRMMNGK